jgi:hypothetical protein
VSCGRGYPDAIDCAAFCWCERLEGRREPNGQWRASCPVPGCKSRRSLEWDAPGKHVRWRSFCSFHDKDAVRPHLARIVGPCVSGGPRREAVRHADLEALALSDLPPLAIKVQLLVFAGMSVTEALDLMKVDRTTRYRIRGQLSQFRDKAAGRNG